ncbi:inositol polyphosphate-5-phosphatase A isoform X2 [Maylandia zebra]|uniref:inositol polyphosphate-5-phosphatase A isoform X2 n=1 Tax=Maylandia zebra TaxID=106582 RepID=UPI00403C1DD0
MTLKVGEIQSEWLKQLYKTIQSYKPHFIALHLQEVGGKDYMLNMGHAENLFWTLGSSEEMKDFDRSCIYVDNQFKGDSFTLLKYDKEVAAFDDVIREEDIKFPPSYPYSEEHAKPTQYMNTRCPAWCDRILMSHTAQDLIHRRDDGEKSVVYNTMGPNVCMGDHKPVFLSFSLKTNDHI